MYDNWAEGELVSGPNITRHWVTCAFMWDLDKMPDPSGGKRLLDYDCRVTYKKDKIIKPRKIRTPDDVRPGTKKGKLDTHIFVVWVDNESGVLARVVGLFSGRGYNIESLAVAEVDATKIFQELPS